MANKPYLDIYAGMLLEDRATGGTPGTSIQYTSSDPIKIHEHDIELKVDNQLVKVNELGQLTVNLDEIGSELSDKANISLDNISDAGKTVVRNLLATTSLPGTVKIDNKTIVLNNDGEISAVKPTSVIGDRYGIKGDYSTHYGILDCPNGLIDITGNKKLRVHSGIVMQCAGQRAKTTIASDNIIDVDSTSNFVLFYACGAFLECGDVFYQEEEPDNGVSNYVAWFNPNEATNPTLQWQFKSNDTGNVFRPTVATPIANVYLNDTGTAITRVDHIGYRILDDECFALKSELPKNGQLMTGQAPSIPDIDKDTINTIDLLVPMINIILSQLRNRGIIA